MAPIRALEVEGLLRDDMLELDGDPGELSPPFGDPNPARDGDDIS